MSDKIFYTWYRLFLRVHGPGVSAEVAAFFFWMLLWIFNWMTLAVMALLAVDAQPETKRVIFNGCYVAIACTFIIQYRRCLGVGALARMEKLFRGESARDRTRRRWLAFFHWLLSMLLFGGSLWLGYLQATGR